MALVTLEDDMCQERDNGNLTLLIFLDLLVISDTINHGIHLDCLSRLGLSGTVLCWFQSYLKGRFQIWSCGTAALTLGFQSTGFPKIPSCFSCFSTPMQS